MQCCLALACDRYDLSLSIQYKAIIEYNKPHDYETIVNHCILSQYGLNKGLEIFGTAGEDAVTKQLTQLHDRGVLDPKHPSELPAEQRHKALSYLMFLKMKRGGDIKGRGCADGRKQREYVSKNVSSSPTVSTEALVLSCMIDVMEGRDVATADIPGAFLQTEYTKGDTRVHINGTSTALWLKCLHK